MKQLHDHDIFKIDMSQSKLEVSGITIKSRPNAKQKGFTLDIKKVNIAKTP